MKITLSAAMRARDVSRPRPEQLADAGDPEEPVTKASGGSPATEGTPQPRARRTPW